MGTNKIDIESKISKVLVYAILFDHLYDIVNGLMNRFEVIVFMILIVFLYYYQVSYTRF